MENCFCETCKDSLQIIIAVPVKIARKIAIPGDCSFWQPTPSEEREQYFTVPCPDCSVSVDYSVTNAQPVAAE